MQIQIKFSFIQQNNVLLCCTQSTPSVQAIGGRFSGHERKKYGITVKFINICVIITGPLHRDAKNGIKDTNKTVREGEKL